MRIRIPPRRVVIEDPPSTALKRLQKQRERIRRFQQRWQRIREDLPPQLSRRHIGMISIGGVIGTGLFLGSSDALVHGGPIGAFLGYFIMGTIVYCLCVSIGEMIAFLPNVGGVVGLADLYVDEALGFSLGWAAWYNWSVTIPAEITAAAVVVGFWDPEYKVPVAATSILFLIVVVLVNCFSSRVYGELEFWLSTIKVITIVVIIVVSLIIDVGGSSQGVIGFKNWSQPFAASYLGITGMKGRFLGFWAVLMQAAFSFFGSEVPGIAAGEVIDATRNVPRALRRVWIRITLFYLGGIFFAGLLVPQDDAGLLRDDGTGRSSPFVIALQRAHWHVLPHIVNASILLSAWSAAASDIYISSRFLFFLGRRKHAPQFLAFLLRYPHKARSTRQRDDTESSDEEKSDSDDEDALEDPGAEPILSKKPWLVLPFASVMVVRDVAFQWLGRNERRFATILAWYGLIICLIVLFTNGWAVFVHNGWRIAEISGETSEVVSIPTNEREINPVSLFLSSYIPIPFFIILTFGYKLINQTKLIPLDEMQFSRGDVPDYYETIQDGPRNLWERFIWWLI
ncbi:Lysine-specific permease [Grifola frondosa]|uniref:Lysine-specific permease n=1 Tax=Grifola frondosa TaxID=5627 RepID=A0A1C7M4A6_GRIFR|nr:Lysine-specific permease [Grifola frondosa]